MNLHDEPQQSVIDRFISSTACTRPVKQKDTTTLYSDATCCPVKMQDTFKAFKSTYAWSK